ncbi:uncharacterized protein [Atheta coriaria]|uniref:uncharacterized protein n=1 Tax=Dalotia coriaria TaxID=877792 RepID=UPI0031F439AE
MCFKVQVVFVLCLIGVSMAAISTTGESNEIKGLDAKFMLNSLASNIMSRGYATTANGGSQVVSLNLTNLLVLVLLKALIFAAGSLGAGTWKGGYGRSADGQEELLTEDEILMYLSYLTGSPGNNACLQNVACRQPNQASRYTTAGEMLLKAGKMLQPGSTEDYEYTLREVKEAVDFGNTGGDCGARYFCGDKKAKK